MYRHFFKRVLDIIISVIGLIILSPVLFLSLIWVKLDSKGPLFFYQERLGYKGRIFRLIKIRTMTDKLRTAHKEIVASADSEVTNAGKVLRRLKIDEAFQILNILKGDMSVVGPRPALVSHMEEFNEDGRARLQVRPGLTGLAQVNGNIYLTWQERWKYDRKYAETVSFVQDIKIILRTVLLLIVGEEKLLNKPDA